MRKRNHRSMGNELRKALSAARERYVQRNPKSRGYFDTSCLSMPGGNTRRVLFHRPFHLAMERGEGSHLWDIDGHRYIDFLGDSSSGLYGHSHPQIPSTVKEALARCLSLSAHNIYES